MRIHYRTGLIALLLLATTACGARTPAARATPDELYQRGVELFERRRWAEAIDTFERLLLDYPGSPRTQDARFHIAEAQFHRREYVTAAAEYVRLAMDYPAGPYAARARVRACESYYELSPRPQLDQTYTQAAIDHCQSLTHYYPGTEHAQRGEQVVHELREKLAEKAFSGGEFYLRRRAYDSAVIYYEDVVRAHPGSSFAPRALARLVEVYGTLGYVEEAEAARERLLREYPTSAEARQVQGISLATGT
jgi:outer membrane protein assembly factor BamD